MQRHSTEINLRSIADRLAGIVQGETLSGPCWIAWRRNGKLLRGRWYDMASLPQALQAAHADLGGHGATTLELCLTQDFRDVPVERLGKEFFNSARGRKGIELRTGKILHRVPPTLSIATNRSFRREIELFLNKTGLDESELNSKARIRTFGSRAFLCRLAPPCEITELYRGNRVIPPEAVTPELMTGTIDGMIGWMHANLAPDGRMAYKYWPSRGDYSGADNTIRQFMATVALGRIARRTGTPEAISALRRNLAFNLGRYYREMEGVGTIILEGKAKLGAVALAGLALLEAKQNGFVSATEYAGEMEGLERCMAVLWQPDGAFRTFLRPAGRNDNQNFYPGEALLFWAALHRATGDSGLRDKCLKSFEFYSAWHRKSPNPAFIPWHSQAYVMLHEDTQVKALADFVFERNDWLLGMQQWGDPLMPDLWGRFYNPERPDYGPPHASSTGVYMEGLADAWKLALSLGEDARAARYARALRRGLRSIAQLQFRDPELDAYYISRKRAVMGGLRTETYHNEIRVDNVQHCLMALLKFEKDARFPWSGIP